MEELLEKIEKVREEQAGLVFERFDEETAWEIGNRIRETADKHHYPLAVSVTLNRRRLFWCSMPGAAPVNDEWVRRKENTVYRFFKSSYEMGLYMKMKGYRFDTKYGLAEADYAAAGGSVPVAVRGAGIVGAVTVSGLSEEGDHELVVSALRASLGA